MSTLCHHMRTLGGNGLKTRLTAEKKQVHNVFTAKRSRSLFFWCFVTACSNFRLLFVSVLPPMLLYDLDSIKVSSNASQKGYHKATRVL